MCGPRTLSRITVVGGNPHVNSDSRYGHYQEVKGYGLPIRAAASEHRRRDTRLITRGLCWQSKPVLQEFGQKQDNKHTGHQHQSEWDAHTGPLAAFDRQLIGADDVRDVAWDQHAAGNQ